MNDEQQLWRDVQKLMGQFPGFVAIARKIGEIGDLETWQAAEQRKLKAITQEVEKQRLVIAAERTAAETEIGLKNQQLAHRAQEHADKLRLNEAAARDSAQALLDDARGKAAKIVSDAETAAKALDKDVAKLRADKAKLSAEISSLTGQVSGIKDEHSSITAALETAKQEHAGFLKKLLGTADV